MLEPESLNMLLGFAMLGLWVYMAYVYFKNIKNQIELILGIIGLLFFILFLIGSII